VSSDPGERLGVAILTRQTGDVHRTISTQTPAPPERLFAAMSDLSTYVHWMKLIERCDPADPASGDAGPAWWVTLRAKVGPFARSKRLRMVRTQLDAPHRARFERVEVDGRAHSEWVMLATVKSSGAGSSDSVVTVELSYSGGFWSGPLDAVLGSQVDDAVPRLRDYVSA
jgi:uncharacterized protein YndB with AHSA1/START domain